MRTPQLPFVLLAALAFVALANCSSDGSRGITMPPVDTTVAVAIASPSLTLRVGTSQPLGASVTVGGRVSTAQPLSFTSDNGIVASVSATGMLQGLRPGTTTVTARTASGASATCIVTVVTGPPATLEQSGGDNQQGRVGAPLATTPFVTVRDSSGYPLPGVAVAFAVVSGGGTIENGSVTTNASGLATSGTWTLGSTAGVNTLRASVPGLSPVLFTATATTTPPVSQPVWFLHVSGGPIAPLPAGALMNPITVQVFDANSNPVANAGIPITAQVVGRPGVLKGTTTVQAVHDRAHFNDLSFDAVGEYAITFTAPGLAEVTSTTFVVTTRRLGLVRVLTPAAGGIAGAAFSTPPVIELVDTLGVRKSGTSYTVTVKNIPAGPPGNGLGSLIGATSVTASNGLFTFSGLGETAPGYYLLEFTSPGFDTPMFSGIQVAAAGARRIDFHIPPLSARSGLPIALQPVLKIVDPIGALVVDATDVVTATITSGAGTLIGTKTVAARAGLAAFTNLGIAGVGAHTITFSIATGSVSATLNVAPPLAQLTMLTQPANGYSGVALSPSPQVTLRDVNGAVATDVHGPVTASIASGSGTLSGSPVVNAVAGVATFNNLRITGSGAHTLVFRSAGTTDAVSASFNVQTFVQQTATHMAFVVQPTTALTGVRFSPPIVVEFRDANGAAVIGSTAGVTLRMASIDVPLFETTAVRAINGVATFTDLYISQPGTYVIEAWANPLSPISSAPITVTQRPNHLWLSVAPGGATSGNALSPQPSVRVLDDGAENVAAPMPVTVSIASGTGTLSGTRTITSVGGVATFTDLKIAGTGPMTLRFSAPGLPPIDSPVFTMTP